MYVPNEIRIWEFEKKIYAQIKNETGTCFDKKKPKKMLQSVMIGEASSRANYLIAM